MAALIREAVVIGYARTMQQDIDFGLRQLNDIALRALSPAVNDPTTAIEVVLRLSSVLRPLVQADLPASVGVGGRTAHPPHPVGPRPRRVRHARVRPTAGVRRAAPAGRTCPGPGTADAAVGEPTPGREPGTRPPARTDPRRAVNGRRCSPGRPRRPPSGRHRLTLWVRARGVGGGRSSGRRRYRS